MSVLKKQAMLNLKRCILFMYMFVFDCYWVSQEVVFKQNIVSCEFIQTWVVYMIGCLICDICLLRRLKCNTSFDKTRISFRKESHYHTHSALDARCRILYVTLLI